MRMRRSIYGQWYKCTGNRKLTDQQCLEIAERAKTEKHEALAAEYGVHESTIRNIKAKRVRMHLWQEKAPAGEAEA